MGVFLDSSVGIKAQRTGMDHIALLKLMRDIVGNEELGTSSIVLTEMWHGVYRTNTPEIRQRRQNFLTAYLRDVTIYPYWQDTAELAGRIGGEQAAMGLTIPSVDLMIGATALSLNFSLLTTNVRHFSMIPNLHVIPF